MRASRIAFAALMVGLLALSACDSSSDSATKTSSGPSSSIAGSSTTDISTTSTSPDQPLTGAATTPTSVAPQSGPKAFLTAVRADTHPGYDRLVLEFEGPAPGYNAKYLTGPLQNDDTGAHIPVDGSSVLKLSMASAASVDVGVTLRETYTGPKRFKPAGTPVLAEVVQVSDFEGTLTWAVGLRQEAPFKVQTLSSPSRVVVDFQA